MSKAELIAKKEELEKAAKAAEKAKKDQEKLAAWETKTHKRNPAFVVGSTRQATDADRAKLTKCHGVVCEIRCTVCGKMRVVNKQDAFQVSTCGPKCRKVVAASVAKEKRLEKKHGSVKEEDLKAEIARLEKMVAAA